MCRYHYQNYGCDIKQAGLNLFFVSSFSSFFVLLFFQPLYRIATSYFYLTSYFPGLRGNLFFITNGELHTDVSTKNVLKHST